MNLIDGNPPALHSSEEAEVVAEALVGASPPSTLPTFTLENRVVAITGGASGLGLVMGKGVVDSGAHLAIVDINSSSRPPYSPPSPQLASL